MRESVEVACVVCEWYARADNKIREACAFLGGAGENDRKVDAGGGAGNERVNIQRQTIGGRLEPKPHLLRPRKGSPP